MATTTPQKSNGEQSGATFSYAQAAKGRSPSVPDTTHNIDKPIAKRTSSEGHVPSTEELKPKGVSEMTSSDKSGTNKSSAPSSPDFGTASTSTLPKEDDPFSSQNGSLESTSDKQSENSQNGPKAVETTETEKPQNDGLSWSDDVPATPALKDAPLPTVNFWQQRKEAQEAKVKASKPSSAHLSKPTEASNGNVAAQKHSGEGKRVDNQRKPIKHSNNLESNPGPGNTRDGNKAGEPKMRNGDDGKVPVRGPRNNEHQRISSAVAAPLPPRGDAMSWPTPDSAQDEEKKKAQERAEKAGKDKGNAPVPKPHGKEKWTAIPFVPSPVFNTPIPQTRPRGGGRPNRGGRDGVAGRGGIANPATNDLERSEAHGGFANQPVPSANDRGRADFNSSKPQSTGSNPKRSASAGPPTSREQRKVGDSPSTEKRKNQDGTGPKPGPTRAAIASETRNAPSATHNDQDINGHSAPRLPLSEVGQASHQNLPSTVDSGDRRQSASNASLDPQSHSRSLGSDRRVDGSRPYDYSRDFFGPAPVRERGEGRPERGRGGYRGRGNGSHGFANGSFVNGNGYANGHTSQNQPPSMSPTKTLPNHERHNSQSQGSSSFQSQSHPRNFRSNSRSQSITHTAPYGRYSNGPYPGAPHLANIQTDVANGWGFQPGNQGPMSAMPYSPYADQVSLYGMVSMQMEYYFSLDNLCKDMFLRKHMDSKGFVFLSVLASFNRIRQLTQDMDLIKFVCMSSTNIEICSGADGIDRLRRQEGWQQWILSMEERDPSAQNDGPTNLQQPRISQPPVFAMPYGYDEMSGAPTPYITQSPMLDNGHSKQLDGVGSSVGSPNGAGPMTNGSTGVASEKKTQFSPSVPEFAPASSATNGRTFSPNESQGNNASSFTDEQVESLMIIVRKPISTAAALPPPFHSASSRTFSNGSIDGRTIHDELAKFEERHSCPSNGSIGPQLEFNVSQRARSPMSVGSPQRQVNSNASPVFWVKDKGIPIDSLPTDVIHESYNTFRVNALQQRDKSGPGACHHDMDILYQFWSHFLIRNFNARIYEEFRRVAFEDANQRDSKVGLRNLIQYYNESMIGEKVISDDIARDYFDLVKGEGSGSERPAFDKLRSAWRNGATNMKNRKKIDNVLDASLKARLEK